MIAVGALVAFCSAICAATAIVLQSTEAHTAPAEHSLKLSLLFSLARRRRWVIGTALVILAWPLQVVALSFAPITVVQPILASFQLVLVILARVWLKERAGWRELGGALAIVAGVTVVIVAAPHRSVLHPPAGRLIPPLVIIGAGALIGYALGRIHDRRGLELTIAAGLGYAWVDFADKLLSNAITSHETLTAVAWIVAIVGFGVTAFLGEQSALAHRPAVQVGPLIGALEEPLPVLLALWGGVEAWGGGVARATALIAGLVLVGVGVVVLARSPTVAHISAAAHGAE